MSWDCLNELHIYERDKDRMDVFIQSLRDNWINVDEYLSLEEREKKDRERVLREYMNAISIIKRELLGKEKVESRFKHKPGLWANLSRLSGCTVKQWRN